MGVFRLVTALAEDWSLIQPHVERALSHSGGKATLEEVKQKLDQQLLCAYGVIEQTEQGPTLRAVMVTEVRDYATKTIFVVAGLSGDGWDLWGAWLIEQIKTLAMAHACTEVQAIGRRGWLKALSKHGWQEEFVCMGLPL